MNLNLPSLNSSVLTLGGYPENRPEGDWYWTYVIDPKSAKWQVPMDTLRVGDLIISAEASNATLDTSVDYIQLNEEDFDDWWNAVIAGVDEDKFICGKMTLNSTLFPVCTCNGTDMFPNFLI